MIRYWVRHRLLFSIIVCVALMIVEGLLFVRPYIYQQASNYNSQSLYKNTEIDFIAPEPSFNQVRELPGTHGIDKVFPFFLTKTQVSVNATSRTTTILLSDMLDNVDMTMYSPARLIKKSNESYEHPIYVDWQFFKYTSAEIGDSVTFSLGGEKKEYRIAAVYETNSVYEGGAVLAPINEAEFAAIIDRSDSSGYSGMYIASTDYAACRTFLTSEYRPLGRLRDRDEFDSDEQYQVHYSAIMESGYANEITDFRLKEASLDKFNDALIVWIGAIISCTVLIVANIIMSNRGSEKGYFSKHCIPNGQNVKPYYGCVFLFNIIFSLLLYGIIFYMVITMSSDYVAPKALTMALIIIPLAIVLSESVNLIINLSMVKDMVIKSRENSRN